MVLAAYGSFLTNLRRAWMLTQPARRRSGPASHRRIPVAAEAESLEVRIVPAAKPVLSIAPAATMVEGNSDTQQAVFTVTLSKASANTVSLAYITTDGTATAKDNDYVAASGMLTFAPGETSKTISITINGDTKFEADETFGVLIGAVTNARLGKSEATTTITNDDTAPTVSIGTPETVFEGNSGTRTVYFPVTLTSASSQSITVRYSTVDGTATVVGNDYKAASGSLTFAPGETTKMIPVTIYGDTTVESDETFSVNLSLPSTSNTTITNGTATATIGDDDTLPVLNVNNPATIDEGATGTVTLLFTVTLSSASTDTVTVAYTTADGTATTADNDYQLTTGTLTFAPGETTKTISVVVKSDTKAEANETFLMKLSTPTNARIADGEGTGTITNDDFSTPVVSVTQPVTVTEGNDGTVDAVFHVTLSQPAGQTVTVQVTTADGTATVAGNDYVQNTQTITFAPGESDKTFTVKVNGDVNLEGNETFSVNLSSPTNATLGTVQAIGTITNDDSGTVSITRTADAAETNPPSDGKFTVTLSGVSIQDTVITYTVSGTATAGVDYEELSGTITIPAGQTSATIDVTPYIDEETEDAETVIVTLTELTSHASTVALDSNPDKLTATIQVLDASGLPGLDVGGDDVTYVAKKAAIKIVPEITVQDTDLGGGTLSISIDAPVANNKLVDNVKFPRFNSLGTSASGLQYLNGQLILTIDLNANVTAADVQKYLRAIKFSTKGVGLETATREFVVTLANAAGNSSTATQTINVQGGSAPT